MPLHLYIDAKVRLFFSLSTMAGRIIFFREICVDYRGKHYLWGSKCVQRRRCATLDTVFNVRILSILYLLLCFSREW